MPTLLRPSQLYKLTALGLTLAVSVSLSPLALGQANQPYWDNNGDNSYYSPQPAQQQQQPQYNNNYNADPYGNYQQQNNYNQGYNQGYQQPDLKGYVATAPVGTRMNVTSNVMVSSEYAQIGDTVSFPLAGDLAIGGSTVIPSGSVILGQVVHVRNAGRTGRHGEIQLRFNQAQLADGRMIPLSAKMVTEDGTGMIKGGTGGQRAGTYAKRTVGGAAVGAGTGALIGLISGGGRGAGRGALYGTAIGGGAGLGSSLYNRGEEAVIRPGQPIQIMLDQPLTVTNSNGGGYNNNYAPQNNYNYAPQY